MADKSTLFDWSMLDRTSLINYLLEIEEEAIGKHLPVSLIHSLLTKQIKSVLPIRTRKCYDKTVEKGLIYIGGMYFSDWDQERKKCIEIQFYYTSPNSTIFLDSRRFKRLCACFADTLLHEIIHMRQFRRRNFKDLPAYESNAEKTKKRLEQSYLGNSDEIDAYSFNIACELAEKFKYDQSKIVDYLHEHQKNKRRKHNSWRMYLKAFDHDHNHIIIKRVKKKVIRYLPFAEIGKPYKNKDWITW